MSIPAINDAVILLRLSHLCHSLNCVLGERLYIFIIYVFKDDWGVSFSLLAYFWRYFCYALNLLLDRCSELKRCPFGSLTRQTAPVCWIPFKRLLWKVLNDVDSVVEFGENGVNVWGTPGWTDTAFPVGHIWLHKAARLSDCVFFLIVQTDFKELCWLLRSSLNQSWQFILVFVFFYCYIMTWHFNDGLHNID